VRCDSWRIYSKRDSGRSEETMERDRGAQTVCGRIKSWRPYAEPRRRTSHSERCSNDMRVGLGRLGLPTLRYRCRRPKEKTG